MHPFGSRNDAFARPPSTLNLAGRTPRPRTRFSPTSTGGVPLPPLRPVPVTKHGPERDRRRPSQDRSDIPTARRAIDMSPKNDRCTSQAPVKPGQDLPDTAATLSLSRPVIPCSLEIIRHAGKADHRTHKTGTICQRNEQNRLRTASVMSSSGNSRPCDTAYACHYCASHYWGRRRYGPVQQGFEMA